MVREKFYNSIKARYKDAEPNLFAYNTERPHQGRGLNGRPPADVFVRCLPKLGTAKGRQEEETCLNQNSAQNANC